MPKIKKIGISGYFANELAKEKATEVIKILKKEDIDVQIDRGFALVKGGTPLEDFDCELILVFGGDGSLFYAARKIKKDIPILGVNFGELGYLMALNYEGLLKNLQKILNKEYIIEKKTRIEIANNPKIPPALNEITLVPKKVGKIIHFNLRIDNEIVWRDSSDGLVIATATGSTGHALSAGGSRIYKDAPVISVVSLNSIKKSRRPLVVNEDSKINIFSSPEERDWEIIIDGQTRFPISHNYIIQKTRPIRLAKLPIQKNKIEWKKIEDLSPAAKFILKVLDDNEILTQKEIIEKTTLPERTVRRQLKELIKREIIVRTSYSEDTRIKLYKITK